MAVIGIDPGVSGAVVLMGEDGFYVDHQMMPTMQVGKRNCVNASALASIVRDWCKQHVIKMVYLEAVGTRPGEGAVGAFSFGRGLGTIEGVVAALALPLTLVQPQSWKRSAMLIGQDKDAARTRCIQLYPQLDIFNTKIRGQAIADAILIARHGLSKL